MSSQFVILYPSVKCVRPGEPVILTCIAYTREPTIMSWSSECYIGNGGQTIAFTSFTNATTTTPSTLNGSRTVAMYHGFQNESGILVHISTLLIEDLMDGPCYVTCYTNHDQENKTTIQVLGNKSCN